MEALAPAPDDAPAFNTDGRLWIDRRDEAQRVVDFVLRAGSPVVLLYGRHGTGKTSLIRTQALQLIPPDLPAFYGDCAGKLPDRVRGRDGDEVDLRTAASRPGVIFLDSFETVLDLPAAERERQFLRLRPSADSRATTAVIFNEDRLGRAFGLRSHLPKILEASTEIRPIGSGRGEGEMHLSLSGSSLEYESEVLEAVASEAERLGARTGSLTPSLLQAVDVQFRRYFDGTSGAKVSLQDYKAKGGLWKVLRDYLRGSLDALGEDQALALALLDEQTAALRVGTPADAAGVCLRTDASETDFQRVAGRLQEAGLLKLCENGRRELVPPELAAVVESEVAEVTEPSRRLLRQGLDAWREVGGLLPPENFAAVHRQAPLLRPAREEIEFLVRCALQQAGESGLGPAAHWLGRLEPRQARIELLLPLLADADAAVRRRTAELLSSFDELEVRHHLHMVALQDSVEDVRRQAVASLQGMQREGLLDFLLQEVSDIHSPYRHRAVETLKIFPEARTVQELRCIVADGHSPADLRHLAIGALASFEIPEAAQALIDISLRDADSDDRLAALDEVGVSKSPALLGNLLQILRERALQQDRWWGPGRFGLAQAAVRLATSTGLVFVNGFLHGTLLLRLRRWRSAIALIAIEATGIGLMAAGSDDGSPLSFVGLALFWATFLYGYFAPLHILLRERDDRRPRQGSIEGTLGVVLFVADALLPSFLMHGFLHAAGRRYARAAALFAAELAGIGVFSVVLNRQEMFYIFGSRFGEPWFFYALLWFYGVVSVVMFVGSWLWDVVGMAGDLVVSGRNALSERLMSNALAASAVIEQVTSPEPTAAGWARGMVRRYRTDMPPELLLDRLPQVDPGTRKLLLPGLRAKRGDAVEAMLKRWQPAEPQMRRWIVSLLARRPTERSVKALRQQLWPDLLFWQRRRAWGADWHWRFRVWPKTMLVAAFLLLPLVLFLGSEFWRTRQNPGWPLIKVLWNENATTEPVEVRIGAAEFLAKAYPGSSRDALLAALDGSRNQQVRLGVINSLAMAAVGISDNEFSKLGLRTQVVAALADHLRHAKGDPESRDAQERRERIVAGLRRIAELRPEAVAAGAAPALLAILKDRTEELSFRQAALDVLQNARAVQAIEQFLTVSLGRRANAGGYVDLAARGRAAADEEALRLEAVEGLGRMGTLDAHLALHRLAHGELPTELRPQVLEELGDPLRRLREDLEAERYDAVLRDGEAFAKTEEPDISRLDVLLLLARASLGQAARLPAAEAYRAPDLTQKGIEYLGEAARLGELPPDARRLLAEALIAEGDRLKAANELDAARARWLRAVEVDPSLPASRRSLLLLQGGKPELAEPEALAAVEEDPRDALAYETLRQSLLQRGEARKAERVFQGLSEGKPNESLPKLNLAFIYQETLSAEDPQAFAKAYDEMERLVAQERRARREPPALWLANLAELSLTTGRYREAEAIAKELLENGLVPADSVTAVNLHCLRYLALVLERRTAEAGQALTSLEERYRGLDAGAANTWSYSGLKTYLQRDVRLPARLRLELLALVDLVQKPNPGSREAWSTFQRNRAALGITAKAK